MNKRYKRTGRKCKRCPTCGKIKRIAMKSKRTNRRMYGGRKYRKTRRKTGGRKYFMKGGDVGGVLLLTGPEIEFQAGFVDEGDKEGSTFKPSDFKDSDNNEFPKTKISEDNIAGIDQGTDVLHGGKERAVKIFFKDGSKVVNRGKGGRHVIVVEKDKSIKIGDIKHDVGSLSPKTGRKTVLESVNGELKDVSVDILNTPSTMPDAPSSTISTPSEPDTAPTPLSPTISTPSESLTSKTATPQLSNIPVSTDPVPSAA
jgi:hypothetical protein